MGELIIPADDPHLRDCRNQWQRDEHAVGASELAPAGSGGRNATEVDGESDEENDSEDGSEDVSDDER